MLKSDKRALSEKFARISTSYHEAGHVIYALLSFMKVSSSTVYSNSSNEGLTIFYNLDYRRIKDPNLSRFVLVKEICFLYSGFVAEKMFYSKISGEKTFPIALRSGSYYDNLSSWKLIKQNNLAESGKIVKYKKMMIRDVSKSISQYWSDVQLIAFGIMKRKLNSKDIRRILTTRSSNKEFWKARFATTKKIFKFKIYDEPYFKQVLNVA